MALDDLLSYPDEEPAGPPAPRPRLLFHWVLKPFGLALAGGVLGGLLLRATGLAVPYPLAVMVLLAVLLLVRIVRWIEVRPVPEGLRGGQRPPPVEPGPPDGLYLATAVWDTRLAWLRLQNDPEQFTRTVQPRLVKLVDERLKLRHGVSRQDQPEQARILLGEPLWAFVTTPVRKTMRPRDLAELVSRMEAI